MIRIVPRQFQFSGHRSIRGPRFVLEQGRLSGGGNGNPIMVCELPFKSIPKHDQRVQIISPKLPKFSGGRIHLEDCI